MARDEEAGRRVKAGRLTRLAGMARAGGGVVRGLLERDAVAPLGRAVETLAELRGLGTKVGQMAGIWSAMLPEDQRERAEVLLARLRAGTFASSREDVRALVEAELGAPLEELFTTFEAEPFASASIGQVHRATLGDGTSVAVKVQHPGIGDAMRADLDNAAALGGVAGLLMMPGAGAELMREVRASLEAELDYVREAAWLTRFEEITRGDPLVGVPALVADRSSARVLTTHFVEGENVDAAARRSTARAQGRAVRRFVLDAWLEHGLLFADPHAGNWIFHDDGRVTVLDFGCVIPFEASVRASLSRVVKLLRAGDERGARDAIAVLVGVEGRAVASLAEPFRLALAPLALDRRVQTSDLRRLADTTASAKRAMLGRRVAIPSWLPLTLRALVGTASLLASLESRCE